MPFLQTPGHQKARSKLSFVHSQVEMGNLHGLEKRYRKKRALEDHPRVL